MTSKTHMSHLPVVKGWLNEAPEDRVMTLVEDPSFAAIIRGAISELEMLLQSTQEQLEAVRKGLEREANIADRYVTGPHGAIRSAWADMAGNLRQLAAYLGSNPASSHLVGCDVPYCDGACEESGVA